MKRDIPKVTILSVHNPHERRCLGPTAAPSRDRDFRRIYFDRLFVPGIAAIGRGKRDDAGLGIRRQFHTGAIEFYYVANGVFDIVAGEESYIVKGGDVLIIPPGVQHVGGVMPLQKPNFYWLIIRMPHAGEHFLGLSAADTKHLFTALRVLCARPLAVGGALKPMFDEMLAALIRREPLAGAIVSRHVLAIMLDVVKCASEKPGRDARRATERIDRVRDHIRSHMHEAMTLKSLSMSCGISSATMRREFKRSVGVPLHDYIIREKIRNAEQILRNSGVSISDIAYDFGFSSPAHFSSAFKKWTGQTPQSYRAEASVATGTGRNAH